MNDQNDYKDLLSELDREALEQAVVLWSTLQKIVGRGTPRNSDLREMMDHIHAIQNCIMSQAARRAFPDQFRMLGEVGRWDERNPHLPEAPADGKHMFGEDGQSYRCSRCGVYNRAQPQNQPFFEPCEGGWAESGKMRAWANDQWAADKETANALPDP